MKKETLPSFEETEELPSFEQTEELPSFEQTEELPSFEETENLEPISTTEDSSIKLPAPLIGYAAGKAIQKGVPLAGKMLEKAQESIAMLGGTTPENLKLIKENYRQYKKMDPIVPMDELLFKTRGTNQKAIDLYNQAEKLLADKKITPDEYIDIVRRAVLEKNKYGTPTYAKPISQSEITKATKKAAEEALELSKNRYELLAEEYADAKAKKQVEDYVRQNLSVSDEVKKHLYQNFKTKALKNTPEFPRMVPEYLKDVRNLRASEVEKLQTGLSKQFPELKGTSMFPSEEASFKKILGLKSSSDIRGDELQEMLRTLRDKAFTEDGRLSEKPAASTSKQIRSKISELSPEASDLMQKEFQEISKLEELEKSGYIERKKAGKVTEISMTDTQRNNLLKDLANAYDKQKPTDVIERIEVLKKYLPEEEFNKLTLAASKLAEKKAEGINYINARPINAILQSVRLRKISRALATIPQQIASFFPEPVVKATGKVGKKALKALPLVGTVVGGLAGYAEAKEEGFPEALAMAYGGLEAVNPLPVSPIETYKGVEQAGKGRAENIASSFEGARKFEEKMRRRELIEKAEEAGALAPNYVEAPKPTVLKADDFSEIGTIAQKLSSSPDAASQEYARVLNKVVNAPEREREAILFGLNQQPAFRQRLKELEEEDKDMKFDLY